MDLPRAQLLVYRHASAVGDLGLADALTARLFARAPFSPAPPSPAARRAVETLCRQLGIARDAD
jgi:hypothetical protein